MAPTDPSGTVLEDCLRVRQSGAIRVLVALVRMILDLWTRASSMWLLGEFGILLFCSPGFWDVGGLLRALRRGPRLIARTSLQMQCLPCGDIHLPLIAALVISSRHRSRLTFGWLLLLLTCVRSLGRYAWSPLPAARLSESAGSRVGEFD